MQKLQHYTVGLAALLIVMAVFQAMPQWHSTLTFNSEQVMSQGWPLLTAHLLHLDWTHALFNALGLLVIVVAWRHLFSARWLINAVMLSAVTTSLLLWLLPWEVQFVGLSGVLHGLLMYALLKDVKQHRWLWIVVVALLAKVVAELLGWRPDHFVGPDVAYIHAAGLISSLVLLKLEQRRLSYAAPDVLKNQQKDD